MRLRRRARDRVTRAAACRLCLGTGKVPCIDNHFDLWMVPCRACQGATAGTHTAV